MPPQEPHETKQVAITSNALVNGDTTYEQRDFSSTEADSQNIILCNKDVTHGTMDTEFDSDNASMTTTSTFPRIESLNSFVNTTCENLLGDEDTMKVNNTKRKNVGSHLAQRRLRIISIVLLIVAIAMKRILKDYLSGATLTLGPNSVYVPGAGFSGFWFTLGRLQSIPDPMEHTYYCFSAGCLGVVATLQNRTMDDVLRMALGSQKRWRDGDISRYDVVEDFVDRLVPGSNGGDFDARFMEKINVVTTTRGVGANIRRPENIDMLRQMLVQTTWIPFATGWGFWKSDGDRNWHMDGGVTMLLHPHCQYNLGLPLSLDLFLNVVNPNMGIDKVKKFWNMGLDYGL